MKNHARPAFYLRIFDVTIHFFQNYVFLQTFQILRHTATFHLHFIYTCIQTHFSHVLFPFRYIMWKQKWKRTILQVFFVLFHLSLNSPFHSIYQLFFHIYIYLQMGFLSLSLYIMCEQNKRETFNNSSCSFTFINSSFQSTYNLIISWHLYQFLGITYHH